MPRPCGWYLQAAGEVHTAAWLDAEAEAVIAAAKASAKPAPKGGAKAKAKSKSKSVVDGGLAHVDVVDDCAGKDLEPNEPPSKKAKVTTPDTSEHPDSPAPPAIGGLVKHAERI